MIIEKTRRRFRGGSDSRWRRCWPVLTCLAAASWTGPFTVASAAERTGRELLAATVDVETPEVFTIQRTKRYLKVVDAECGNGFCEAKVANLRNNKLLRVENVSCRIDTSSEALADFVAMIAADPDSSADFDIYVPHVISGSAPDETWSFNHETTFYAYPRRRVSIQAEFNGGSLDAMTCKVAGELQTVR